MRARLAAFLLCAVLVGCGDEPRASAPSGAAGPVEPAWVRVPDLPWARVSPEQVECARRMGVPVAFENAWGMRFVFVPDGAFRMGSPPEEAGRGEDEAPHEVRLRFGYFVQTEPVTWAQYGPSPLGRVESVYPADPAAPVTDRGVETVADFAAWLSEQDETWDYRLPTEAEWEHACRAGSTTAFPWGEGPPVDLDTVRTNAWGLTDMCAGVREWCLDRYGPYPTWTVVDPHGPAEGEEHVVRGAWRGSHAAPARCAARGRATMEGTRCDDVGFRLVVPLGYGLGRYGSVPVTFRLVAPAVEGGEVGDPTLYDLRVIRMNERLAAREAGLDPTWSRVPRPGSPATLTFVPGKYYVYAEAPREGHVVRGVEIKFQVWEEPVEVPVPVPEADLSRYGSGTDRPR